MYVFTCQWRVNRQRGWTGTCKGTWRNPANLRDCVWSVTSPENPDEEGCSGRVLVQQFLLELHLQILLHQSGSWDQYSSCTNPGNRISVNPASIRVMRSVFVLHQSGLWSQTFKICTHVEKLERDGIPQKKRSQEIRSVCSRGKGGTI